MGDRMVQRIGDLELSSAPSLESSSRRRGVSTATTPKTALRRALSNFQELLADPRVKWGGKRYDRAECAALEKMLRECERCVEPATSGRRFHEAAQSVTDFLECKTALTAELRSLSKLKCKKRDLPAIFAKKLTIQHQLYRQRFSVPSTTPILELAAAAVEAVGGVYRCAAAELLNAREESEHLRRRLTNPTPDEESARQKAKQLCLEGHAFRFGYGCSPQLSRAYNTYVAAARLGAGEGFTCAGILLEEGLVDMSAYEEDSFLVSGHRTAASDSVPETPSATATGSHPVPSPSEPSSSFSKLGAPEHKQANYGMSDMCSKRYTQRVGTPTLHDKLKKARSFFEQGARLGHPDALFRLGRMTEAVGYAYEQGSVHAEDYGEGNSTGLNNLASLYYRGYGCPVDYEKAATLFKQAAAVGNIHACYNLAVCYEFGRGVLAEDSDRALQLYSQAAKAGHVKASAALGTLLFRLHAAAGKPAAAYAEAARWLQMAASKEDAEAIFILGQLYESGLGLIRDPGQALACYRKAAAGDVSPKVHLRLAHLLFSGQAGTDLPSKKEAFKHYRIAAEKGDEPEAWNCLGLCHEEGLSSTDGVPQYVDAAQCYERAVQLDYADAMCNLARLLTKGVGVPQDTARGFELLKRAASGGHLQAKVALENQGRIVPRPILEVALGYVDASDKPPAPALTPPSPIQGSTRPREIRHIPSVNSGQGCGKGGRAEKRCAQAEDETSVTTLSQDRKSQSNSSTLVYEESSHSSSAKASLSTPRERSESSFPDDTTPPADSASVGKSGNCKEHCIKAFSNMSPASTSTVGKSGSSGRVNAIITAAQEGGRPAPITKLPAKEREKLVATNSKHSHVGNQDATKLPKKLHGTLSPLSPGQVACWLECSPSLSHRVIAASPASKLICRTVVPQGRKSLAHLLYVDRSAPAAIASIQHNSNKSAPRFRNSASALPSSTGSPSVSRDSRSLSGCWENASGCRRQGNLGRRALGKTPIVQEASFVQIPW